MKAETEETTGNEGKDNFIECPYCGQKMLNVLFLGGETEIVVKCRRCRRFIKVLLIP